VCYTICSLFILALWRYNYYIRPDPPWIIIVAFSNVTMFPRIPDIPQVSSYLTSTSCIWQQSENTEYWYHAKHIGCCMDFSGASSVHVTPKYTTAVGSILLVLCYCSILEHIIILTAFMPPWDCMVSRIRIFLIRLHICEHEWYATPTTKNTLNNGPFLSFVGKLSSFRGQPKRVIHN
jgi:hypothetical protein